MNQAAAIVAEAFMDDPLMVYIQPDARRRSRSTAWLSERFVRLGAAAGIVDVEHDDGVAIWIPPGVDAFTPLRLTRAGVALAPLPPPFGIGISAARRMVRSETDLSNCIEAARANDPESIPELPWYFFVLAVRESARGKGVARRLIERGLARADATSSAVRLETNKPGNVPLYEKFGFALVGESDTPGVLPQFVMVRPPA